MPSENLMLYQCPASEEDEETGVEATKASTEHGEGPPTRVAAVRAPWHERNLFQLTS